MSHFDDKSPGQSSIIPESSELSGTRPFTLTRWHTIQIHMIHNGHLKILREDDGICWEPFDNWNNAPDMPQPLTPVIQ